MRRVIPMRKTGRSRNRERPVSYQPLGALGNDFLPSENSGHPSLDGVELLP